MEKKLAIVHLAGKFSIYLVDKEKRREEISSQTGCSVFEFELSQPSFDGYTAATSLERACYFSHTLSSRKYPIIWGARGGMGTTELIPFLENLLPPVIDDKIFIGFSDLSFIGIYLSCRYPNFTYIHALNAFSEKLFQQPNLDKKILFSLIKNLEATAFHFLLDNSYIPGKLLSRMTSFAPQGNWEGCCVPLNLSLAECLSALPQIELPKQNILFLEDLNESLYRIIRKVDTLFNSGFLKNTTAIVLGEFTQCARNDEEASQGKFLSLDFIAELISRKTGLPVFTFPLFGHGERCLPLVAFSTVKIYWNEDEKKYALHLTYEKKKVSQKATAFSTALHNPFLEKTTTPTHVHFFGIGGTGMAPTAGLFQKAGFKVTGSDNPIYPPMDGVIRSLGINPIVGFHADTQEKLNPDAIVLANVVSRKSASLSANLELEKLLEKSDPSTPVFSFPSALRKGLLSESINIVVSGTHGKTTTTGLISHVLTCLDFDPSFLIGGQPVNFSTSFSLTKPHNPKERIFVLEGDEYDSAFFDKGPKFLHYEPSVALINNIEFDHADIYENVEAIEKEFSYLMQLTFDRKGIAVMNMDCARVAKLAQIGLKSGKIIGFGFQEMKNPTHEMLYWQALDFKTTSTGIEVNVKTPFGQTLVFATGLYGAHNASNLVGSLAVMHALSLLKSSHSKQTSWNQTLSENFNLSLEKLQHASKTYKGVKRRFELIGIKKDIAVFDDFAHHPTAIKTTLEAFRHFLKSSGRKDSLIVCFDPRNATMRRNVLQKELIQSLTNADRVMIGKVPVDLRMDKKEMLDGDKVAHELGERAQYFSDNEVLLETLLSSVQPSDTVVFLSSGSFDFLPHRFFEKLK